ncbi:hypothetical protein P0W64_06390 [Tsukamurella sp. 8F]|uniref:hypothetical protein n=1 Tax=unclassified Tsukamurella TaxID=2633480 RepID=UPI0023B9C81D|nr:MULTISPECIES: hypothetical protein [unclassified Tsukamurella]MDF0530081.1 hypothetical protein [Tsukamurella sp. 8J]MDF0586399.1 hypothetical protein [Tsukamurella sp. 8F]
MQHERSHSRIVPRLVTRALRRFGEFRRTQLELIERRDILLEPWTHDVLHWGPDGTLHGSIAGRGLRPPVTRGGWCPCLPFDAIASAAGDGDRRGCGDTTDDPLSC